MRWDGLGKIGASARGQRASALPVVWAVRERGEG